MTPNSEKSDDKKIRDAFDNATALYHNKEYIEALSITETTISDHGKNKLCWYHHQLQGHIFFELASGTEITDIKCVYLFASVDSHSTSILLRPESLDSVRSYYDCACSLVLLGDQPELSRFYKEAVSKATQGLEMLQAQRTSQPLGDTNELETQLLNLKNQATEKMMSAAAVVVFEKSTLGKQLVLVGPKKEQGTTDPSSDRLKNFWVKLDEKTKRECLVVDFRTLVDYIKYWYNEEVKENFKKCVCVLDERLWRCWRCRICPQINYCFMDCKKHILDNHVHKFVTHNSARPKCINKVLADMIRCGDWEPVDTAAATDLIKGRIARGEEFVYVDGWCSDWPVAKDEKREKILQQFSKVLKSSCPDENNTLSSTLWDWLIDYTEENLKLPGVCGWYLDKCSFFKNPQCICFLDLKNLKHILEYFRQLTTTDGRTGLVLTVVDRFWDNSLVKERIDLEPVNFNLLLDERLLDGRLLDGRLLDGRLLDEGEHHFDHETGKVRTLDSSKIYGHVKPKGDKIISWVLDCPEVDTKFVSQMAKGVHNLDIWLAVLRIVRCAALEVVSNYDTRNKMLTYDKMLGEAKTICDKEDNRKNANQRSRYALMLGMECEKRVKLNRDTKRCFLNVVRDVLEEAESPRFEVLEDKKFMKCISRLSNSVQNDVVKESLLKLRKSVAGKYHVIDSGILLSEFTSRKLNELFPKLSAMEYRLVVLPFVKMFLKDKLMKMMKTQNRKPPVAAGAPAEFKKGRR